MQKKTLWVLLILEVVTIAIAITCFRLIADHLVAGAIAGAFFVFLGMAILLVGLRSRPMRRTGTFVMGCVHLFGVALPLMITRLLNSSAAFADVRVLGLPGPVFHQLSTAVYFAMMLATVLDLVLAYRRGALSDSN